MSTALITGATAGIGAAFARRLAADGHRLVLVARDEMRLKALAVELGDRHETLAVDLTEADGLARVEQRLRETADPVELLVNNAGIGSTGTFWTAEQDVLQRQFDLGATAVFRLSRAAVEGMVDRGSGGVLNVASFGALLPGRTGVGYTAAKAYTVTLSEQLAAELAGTGVTVTAVCPGWTKTELHERSGAEAPAAGSKWWLNAEEVVDTALTDLKRGRRRSVAGRRYRLVLAMTDLLPKVFLRSR